MALKNRLRLEVLRSNENRQGLLAAGDVAWAVEPSALFGEDFSVDDLLDFGGIIELEEKETEEEEVEVERAEVEPFQISSSNSGVSPTSLRVFFIPYFASGHVIPMTDLARLFASHPDVEPTIVVTPSNASLIRPTLDRSAATGHPVHLLLYPFPSVGLPPGVENLATAPSSESWRIDKAANLAQDAHDRLLRLHRPDAVVADIHFWWTTTIAADLGIPRITFLAIGAFPILVMNNFHKIRFKIQELENRSETIMVPDFPGPSINIPKSELPEFLRSPKHLTEGGNRLKESQ